MKKLILLLPLLSSANDTELYQRLILIESKAKVSQMESEFISLKKDICKEVFKNEKVFNRLLEECKKDNE